MLLISTFHLSTILELSYSKVKIHMFNKKNTNIIQKYNKCTVNNDLERKDIL